MDDRLERLHRSNWPGRSERIAEATQKSSKEMLHLRRPEVPYAGNGLRLDALRGVDAGGAKMNDRQIKYLTLYESGYSVTEIAKMERKNKSTISRVLKRCNSIRCPFSADCKKCPLPDCAIDEKYAILLNGRSRVKNMKRGTSVKEVDL